MLTGLGGMRSTEYVSQSLFVYVTRHDASPPLNPKGHRVINNATARAPSLSALQRTDYSNPRNFCHYTFPTFPSPIFLGPPIHLSIATSSFCLPVSLRNPSPLYAAFHTYPSISTWNLRGLILGHSGKGIYPLHIRFRACLKHKDKESVLGHPPWTLISSTISTSYRPACPCVQSETFRRVALR